MCLNNRLPKGILSGVARLSKYVAMLLLALWGLVTIHCDLERATGLEILAWCHPTEPVSHQDNSCDGDACSVVESGFYRIEEQPASVPLPQLVLSFVLPLGEAPPPMPATHFEPLIFPPPDLPRAWQFSCRTAARPRSPSLVA
jgi:hypothetical protein